MATSSRDVEARSEACECNGQRWGFQRAQVSAAYLASLLLEEGELLNSTLKVGLRKERKVSIDWLPSGTCVLQRANLSKQLRLGNLLVDLLGEVLLGFQRDVGHLGRRAENSGSEEESWFVVVKVEGDNGGCCVEGWNRTGVDVDERACEWLVTEAVVAMAALPSPPAVAELNLESGGRQMSTLAPRRSGSGC